MISKDTAALALAAYAGGWLLADSDAFEPIRTPIEERLTPRADAGDPVAEWALRGLGCSTCLGFWASFFVVAVTRRRYDMADVLAANGAHMLLQTIEERIGR